MTATDELFMRQALSLAAQGLGRVAPNPSVGCLIVKDGHSIGQARTADGGRPHAETQALEAAGEQARGATVYVTLEPCGNHGVTGPCVAALIRAGVARVVIACRDPSQAEHDCVKTLEAAGIAVIEGVCRDAALALNEGFFLKIRDGRPFVTVKLATTLDGRIATRTGQSRWITGEQARVRAHELRAAHDAVLAGVGTVLADDPLLTVRLPGQDFQPVRIVIDRDLKTPPDSRLARSVEAGLVWIVCADEAGGERRAQLEDRGVIVVPMSCGSDGLFSIKTLLECLARRGITRLLVEGGGVTATGFLKAGMVDRLAWFRAPKLIGGDGVPALQGLGIKSMDDAIGLVLEDRAALGEDFLEIWRLKG